MPLLIRPVRLPQETDHTPRPEPVRTAGSYPKRRRAMESAAGRRT